MKFLLLKYRKFFYRFTNALCLRQFNVNSHHSKYVARFFNAGVNNDEQDTRSSAPEKCICLPPAINNEASLS